MMANAHTLSPRFWLSRLSLQAALLRLMPEQPWMLVVWVLCAVNLILGAGIVAFALQQPWQAEKTLETSVLSGQPPYETLETIPGFQKRGTVLVGEVQGGNGVNLRLVFDSRSQKLIGLKVLDGQGTSQRATTPSTSAPAPLREAHAPAKEKQDNE